MNLPLDSSGLGPSRTSSVRATAPSAALQSVSGSRSAIDMTKIDRGNSEQRRRKGEPPLRSLSMILTSSGSHGQIIDSGSSIFPGVVRERARRKSIRQGSGSEKDSDGGSAILSRSFTRDREETGIDDTVAEVPDEEESN